MFQLSQSGSTFSLLIIFGIFSDTNKFQCRDGSHASKGGCGSEPLQLQSEKVAEDEHRAETVGAGGTTSPITAMFWREA